MKFDKVEVSGIIVLFIGVILLAATFISAYVFLSGKLSILASADLTELFGRALAPLIEAIIHILYLGIMGWVGSILTIRAVQLLKREKETVTTQPQVKSETKQPAPSVATAAKPEVKESKKAEDPEKTPVQEQPAKPEKEAQTK